MDRRLGIDQWSSIERGPHEIIVMRQKEMTMINLLQWNRFWKNSKRRNRGIENHIRFTLESSGCCDFSFVVDHESNHETEDSELVTAAFTGEGREKYLLADICYLA